jgi:hypothetical protein
MPIEGTPRAEEPKVEQRILDLEKALALDTRLQALESQIQARTAVSKPWWRDAKTVTILGALITAVIPLLSFINNSFASSRESRRLLVDQQNKIRQLYLDRVFKPGVTETEQRKIFELLSHLSSDPEMQQWANGELQQTNQTIADVNKLIANFKDQLAQTKKTDELAQNKLKESISRLERRLGTPDVQQEIVGTKITINPAVKDPVLGWDINVVVRADSISEIKVLINDILEVDYKPQDQGDGNVRSWERQFTQKGKNSGDNKVSVTVVNADGHETRAQRRW